MTVATKLQPNYTTQDAASYKASIDAMTAVHDRIASAFAPHEQDVGSPAPDMTMRVDAGFIFSGTTLTEVAAQTVSGFTTPSAGQERIDRVVIDASTGAASRVAGTAVSGSPSAVPPAIPSGKLPCCQIQFTDSSVSVLNSMITDERIGSGGASSAATQSEQEAGTSTTAMVTPGRQQYHPSAAKCWVVADMAGNIGASYNMTSVTDTGTGVVTLTIATDFSSGSYCAVVSVDPSGGGIFGGATGTERAAGSFVVRTYNSITQVAQDTSLVMAAAYGDQ